MELGRQLQNMPAWIRERVASMDRRRRTVVGALAAVALAGAAWLVLGSGPEKWALVLETTDGAMRTAAVEKLDKLGIAHREEGAILLVRPEEAAGARAAIASGSRVGDEAAAGTGEGQDLWQTESQRARRGQAEKAATLGRLITRLPGVKNAVVLLEAATSKGLGRSAQSATAAVNVTMADGQELTRELAVKMARLISGSVVSMRCEDVRIIDSGGPSVRVDESGQPAPAAPGLQARWTQGEAVQAVQASLQHVGDVRVRVGVAAGESPKVTGVWVSVPESYLAGGEGPDSAREAAAGIRRVAARATGVNETEVTVACHRDASAGRPATPASVAGGSARAAWLWAVPAGTGAIVVVLTGLVVRRRLRRRRPAGATSPRTGVVPPAQARLPQLLQSIPCDELLTAVREEHPQTLAVALSQMDAARAASLLGGLDEAVQVAVARRLAELESIDPDVRAAVEGALATRLAAVVQRASSRTGPGQLVAILRQAGAATEQAVMDALADESPALAQSIRGQMFAFEDLLGVSPSRLGEALREFATDEVAVALRTASKELTGRFLSCLASGVAGRLRRELAAAAPVRISDVEAAQERIVRAVQYASEESAAAREPSHDKSH
ncbi:MAG: FliG C-terminal domain-containing protein [Planctomycetota bacterium]